MPIADIFDTPHVYDLFQPSAPPAKPEMSLPARAQNGDRTLVFIHGWLLSRAYWQPLVDQLQSQYCCLTYDMRGFGESASGASSTEPRTISLPLNKDWYPDAAPSVAIDSVAIEGDFLGARPSQRAVDNASKAPLTYRASAYSLAAYAQDLGELLDTLGLNDVWLAGHSLGGSVALWAAYLLPERVKGVICLNAGGGIYIPKEFKKFRSAGQQMVKYRPAWLPQVPLLPRVFTRAMVHKTLDIQWGQQRLKDFVGAQRTAAEGALLESTTAAEVHQLPKLVGQLTQRVQFITASQDTIMLPRYVNYLASFHPQFDQLAMVSEIPECGHMAMVEQPEAVAAVMREVVG